MLSFGSAFALHLLADIVKRLLNRLAAMSTGSCGRGWSSAIIRENLLFSSLSALAGDNFIAIFIEFDVHHVHFVDAEDVVPFAVMVGDGPGRVWTIFVDELLLFLLEKFLLQAYLGLVI